MAAEFRLTKEAEADLLSIAAFTAERFGLVQEIRYRDGLRKVFDLLSLFPAMGAEQSRIAEGLRRHVYESHAIFYSEQTYGVLIERVLGPGQDPIREFPA